MMLKKNRIKDKFFPVPKIIVFSLFALGVFVLLQRFPILPAYSLRDIQKPQKLTYSRENMWGSPAKGLYPQLTHPHYVAGGKADKFLQDDDEVIALTSKDSILVYPNVILGYHHVVNDTVDGVDVAITYCCQTDSVFVYDRSVDGNVLTFEALGPLYWGNKVLYDIESGSYWIQMTGDSFDGTYKGKTLRVAGNVDRSTWREVKNDPHTKVLAPVEKMQFYRDWYNRMQVEGAGLFALEQKKAVDPRLPPYTRGIGVAVNGRTAFYPLEKLSGRTSIEDTIGSTKIHLTSNNQFHSWRVDTSTYTQVYWFAWSAFYGETTIWDGSQ